MSKIVRTLLAFVFLFGMAASLEAHPVPFSFLDIHLTPAAIEVSLVVHDFDIAHDLDIAPPERFLDPRVVAERTEPLKALLGSRFQLTADGRVLTPEWSEPEILRERQSLRFRLRYPTSSIPGVLQITAYMFPYDPVHQTFVNIYEGDELTLQVILNSMEKQAEYISGTRQGILAVIRKFVPEGVHHILIGPDHVLFLIGLLLLGGSMKRLLLVVSAFTLAHSITLSLAALNILNPPARLIEPAIALSIVYVGFDNLLVRGGRDVRAWIAFAFGFIHGFGFANVLREMNLPSRALGWSLFSFNVGVEIGQMFVVVVVAFALAMLRSRSEKAGRQVVFAGSIVVIVAGAFWFVQRVFLNGLF